MRALSDLAVRLRALFRPAATRRAIDEEVRFHFDQQVDAFEQAGLTRAEAIRRARLEFGFPDHIKEEYRDAMGVRIADECARDLRIAVRSLRGTPVVTMAAVLSLALAIGANTAIFSIVNGLLLRPLPVKDPERLVLLTDSVPTRLRTWSHPLWEHFRSRPQLFENVTAWSFMRVNLASGGETRFVQALLASGSFFDTLGVSTALGRPFSTRDDRRGGGPDGPVTVISDVFWRQRFGGAADAVGRTLQLDQVAFTIVGVTPPGFLGPDVGRAFDVILPLESEALIRGRDTRLDDHGTNFLTILGRLRADLGRLRASRTLEDTAADLRIVQPRIREATVAAWGVGQSKDAIDRYLKSPITLQSAATGYSGLRVRYEQPLIAIMVLVALVLLVACVNIANLLLARGAARRPEMTIRLALGASRIRLVRQLLIESLVLGGTGAGLGLVLAVWTSRALVSQLSTPDLPIALNLPVDARVLAFTIGATVLTAMLFGSVPSWRASRVRPGDTLKQHGRIIQGSHGGLQEWLVAAQVALSLVLIVAAGSLVRSFVSLSTRELGFQPDRVLTVSVGTQHAGVDPSQRIPVFERVRDAVLAVPDVAQAGLSMVTPGGSSGFSPRVAVSGEVRPDSTNVEVVANLISPGWFRTFGTPVLSGRDLSDTDRKGAARVAVVNESFVRTFLGSGSPLGRTIVVYAGTPRALPPMEIVGVVADAVYYSPRERAVPPTWYAPISQFDLPQLSPIFNSLSLSVRPRTGSPASLINTVSEAVADVNPKLALTFRPLADRLRAALVQERLTAMLAGAFGVLALLLASLGVYGVTAYGVARRRTEIGIRMALGAAPQGVVAAILGRMARVVGVGLGVGTAVSLWAASFVAPIVHFVDPRDPATFAAAAVTLVTVGLLAGWLPARRASRIDPIAVLREG